MASIDFDITELVNAYKAGFEAAFMMFHSTSELDETLLCNGIVTKSDEYNDEV